MDLVDLAAIELKFRFACCRVTFQFAAQFDFDFLELMISEFPPPKPPSEIINEIRNQMAANETNSH